MANNLSLIHTRTILTVIADFSSMHQAYSKGSMFTSIASHFPSLSHLKISFEDDLASCVPQMERIRGQAMLMDGILSNPLCLCPSRLTSLTLNAMVFPWIFCSSLLAMDVLASVTHLNIHFNNIPFGRTPANYMSSYLQNNKLRPNTPPWQLTHLKITADVESIYFTPIDLTALHFPHLQKLVIENMVFRTPLLNVFTPTKNPGAMEAFIVRHTTLRSLVLKDCILVHTRRPWSIVYDRIASTLTRLTDLSVESTTPYRHSACIDDMQVPYGVGPDHTNRRGLGYCNLRSMRHEVSMGTFVKDFIDAPTVAWKDEAALERLKDMVKEREQADRQII